ncbi:MAG: tetratricopeptide repeat protein [Pirellulaceae bacterium]
MADRLGGGIQAAQPMMPLILGAIAIIVVGSIGWGIYAANSQQKSAAAWTDYYFNLASEDPETFSDVADDYPNTPASAWAHQSAGTQLLRKGVDAIYRNRAEGEKLLNQAIESFEMASKSNQVELKSRAHYGLGQAHEALGQLDKAASNYEQVTSQTGFTALSAQAEDRLAFVSGDAGKSFYMWFDKLDPKPDAPIELPSNLSTPPTSPGDMQFDPIDPLGGLGAGPALDPVDLPPLSPQDVNGGAASTGSGNPADATPNITLEPPAAAAPESPAAAPEEAPTTETPASGSQP